MLQRVRHHWQVASRKRAVRAVLGVCALFLAFVSFRFAPSHFETQTPVEKLIRQRLESKITTDVMREQLRALLAPQTLTLNEERLVLQASEAISMLAQIKIQKEARSRIAAIEYIGKVQDQISLTRKSILRTKDSKDAFEALVRVYHREVIRLSETSVITHEFSPKAFRIEAADFEIELPDLS